MPSRQKKKTSSATSLTGAAKRKQKPSIEIDRTTRYALQVECGEIKAGKLVRLACKRHLDDLDNGSERGLHWDPARAARVFHFFETYLTLAEGQFSGQPFTLQPWQCFVLGSVFGWLGADGFRRFRTAYIEIAKGNGKSPMAAGVGLYGLMADGENAAEIYAAAVTREQAKIVFRDAENMVEASPRLKAKLIKFVGQITYREKLSYFRPISSEKRGLDGKRPHIAILDEIHEHPDATIVDKMRAGTKGRRQALQFEITNSGYDQLTVCFDHHEQSRQVLEGALDNDSWFGYVASLDEGDDWKRDESCWVKPNPNLGVSVTEKYLREQVKEAIQIPAKQGIVERLNFCIWSQASSAAIRMEDWHACRRDFTEEDLAGKTCYGGLDLSKTTDLTACVLVFSELDDAGRDVYKLLPRFWLPAERAALLEDRDRVPYRMWAQQGFLKLTPGNVVDYDFVRAEIDGDCKKFKVVEMGYDPYNATETATKLQSLGLKVIDIRQGHKTLGAATEKLLALLIDGRMQHNGHPILTWCASNVVTRPDANNNLVPDKVKSTKKIDGISATVNALSRAILHIPTRSVYEDRGVIRL